MSAPTDDELVAAWFRRYDAKNPPVGGDLAGLTMYGNLLVEDRCRRKTQPETSPVFLHGHLDVPATLGVSTIAVAWFGRDAWLDVLAELIPLPTLENLTLGPLWPDL